MFKKKTKKYIYDQSNNILFTRAFAGFCSHIFKFSLDLVTFYALASYNNFLFPFLFFFSTETWWYVHNYLKQWKEFGG